MDIIIIAEVYDGASRSPGRFNQAGTPEHSDKDDRTKEVDYFLLSDD
jgi:hypothetical protein